MTIDQLFKFSGMLDTMRSQLFKAYKDQALLDQTSYREKVANIQLSSTDLGKHLQKLLDKVPDSILDDEGRVD